MPGVNAAGSEIQLLRVGGKAVCGCLACFEWFERRNRRCIIDSDLVNGCLRDIRPTSQSSAPTYFADLTAEMKAVTDRAGFVALANGGQFSRKIAAAVIAVRRGGTTHVFDSITTCFCSLP